MLCKGGSLSIEIPYLGGSNHFWITTNENDIYTDIIDDGLYEFTFKVYNRWGNVVFETKDPDDYWQGEQLEGNGNEGYYVPIGVYTYEIRYSSNCNTEAKDFVGQISVVR